MADNSEGWAAVLAQLGEVRGQLTAIESKADAAHKRIDRMENIVADEVKGLRDDIKPVIAYMNKSKGGMALIVFGLPLAAGAIGAAVVNMLRGGGGG